MLRSKTGLVRRALAAVAIASTTIAITPSVAAADQRHPSPYTDSIADIAGSSEDFEILVSLLEATGLDKAVADPDASLTVFAPTDAAFEALLADPDVATAVQDIDFLTSVLLYHVVGGDFQAFQLAEHDSWTTLNGQSLTFNGEAGTVDGANIVLDGLSASNGVIHVIDSVLIPS